jgi:hypothetical protein
MHHLLSLIDPLWRRKSLSQKRIGILESIGAVCRELPKVYKDIYQDRVDASKAMRLVNTLDKLRKGCESRDTNETLRRADEERMLAIERKLENL